jgi:hypothetical protein
MDPELKHLVQESVALAKENHRLLKAVRRHQIVEFYGKWILWLIVILASAYGFQVYLRPLINTYSTATGASTTGPFGLPTSADIQKLIDSFKAGK